MIKFHVVNGELSPIKEAKIQITDLGLLRGFGIFDFFTIKNSKPVFMQDHLNRFYNSAKLMQLDIAYSQEELTDQILKLVQVNGLENAAIRLVLTGGYSPDGFTPDKPNLLILQHPYKDVDPSIYEKGCKLITYEHTRVLPEVKTTSYFIPILLSKKMAEENAVDVLYHDSNGWITETSRSNFFIISSEGKLVTPNKNILRGITRMHTLEVAYDQLEIEKRDLNMSELSTAREAFITSTTKGVLPIVQVGTQVIGNGKPGKVTKHLGYLLEEFVNDSFGFTKKA
jgi:branched-chain amino acid aminotransferase